PIDGRRSAPPRDAYIHTPLELVRHDSGSCRLPLPPPATPPPPQADSERLVVDRWRYGEGECTGPDTLVGGIIFDVEPSRKLRGPLSPRRWSAGCWSVAFVCPVRF
ncbi:hypothetical protein GWI33_021748, partial [Rhynchophorus ferrugineus]